MNNNTLNRDTLYSDLMEVIFSFLKTTDMKEMTIEKCNELITETKQESATQNKKQYSYNYDYINY